MRLVEKAARFGERVAERGQPQLRGDKIEKIAMVARGGIGPFAGRAGTVGWTGQAHEQAASGRVLDIADDPVAALFAALGQIVSADRFGVS